MKYTNSNSAHDRLPKGWPFRVILIPPALLLCSRCLRLSAISVTSFLSVLFLLFSILDWIPSSNLASFSGLNFLVSVMCLATPISEDCSEAAVKWHQGR